MTIAYLGGIASILAVLLAFYTIFINGRMIKRMLKEHGVILERINETLKYLADLVKTETESLRQEIRKRA
ncbi:MAG: hypothetical protein ABIK93_07015 [candidate division WOR-3 bacterium]